MAGYYNKSTSDAALRGFALPEDNAYNFAFPN
jgi:hypothetical protein